jgi:hypothetical protein
MKVTKKMVQPTSKPNIFEMPDTTTLDKKICDMFIEFDAKLQRYLKTTDAKDPVVNITLMNCLFVFLHSLYGESFKNQLITMLAINVMKEVERDKTGFLFEHTSSKKKPDYVG